MRPFLGSRVRCRAVSAQENATSEDNILGGVGGRSKIRKTTGAATVSMIPRTKIYTDRSGPWRDHAGVGGSYSLPWSAC